MSTPAGIVGVPNQALANAASIAPSVEPSASPSRKIADAPAGMLVTPRSATALAAALELSSIFQPATFTGLLPLLVTSNQSALYVPFPLPAGCTSDTNTVVAGAAETPTGREATYARMPATRLAASQVPRRTGRLTVAFTESCSWGVSSEAEGTVVGWMLKGQRRFRQDCDAA